MDHWHHGGSGYLYLRKCRHEGLWYVQRCHQPDQLKDKVEQIRSKENYTEFAELPETYVDAVLSVEDHRFYGHIGIDPIAITRAVINDIRAGAFVEGGSTITQQLAKNLYFTQEKKMERKAAEVFMAFALEKEYSKKWDSWALCEYYLLWKRILLH